MELSARLGIARELPSPGSALPLAQRYTRWLAKRHYENFTLALWLFPRRLHQHVYNVYAYCRWADDLGDEISPQGDSLELLNWWERELRNCYAGSASHAVFIALKETIEKFDIPIDPFLDLLTAFRQDQRVRRYPNWDVLMGYCRNSANPVGRITLYLCGYRDVERQHLSDATCTALQLANFWQDVSGDLEKGRIYIPLDILSSYGLTEEDLFERRFNEHYVALMRELIARTRGLFAAGLPLVEKVAPRLRVDIELFSRGGLAVLDAIEAIGYNTLRYRPTLTRATQMQFLGRVILGRLYVLLRSNKHTSVSLAGPDV
ncbi:MAG: squalene synthase HpnC [Acidobacteria bacterium]|nr:squalene synthase HpnC [Acidobacteriota bacterium]